MKTGSHSETPLTTDHQLRADERDTFNFYAYTPEHYTPPYPWYINLTMVRMKGDVVLTVRAPTGGDMLGMENRRMGDTSTIRFTREMWNQLVKDIKAANDRFQAADELDAII